MAILPITVYGDKILREKAKPVEKIDDDIILLVRNMFETMRNANGIGLAANQVNIDKQVFVVDVSVVEGLEHIKPVAMINPEILLTSDETVIFEEGCLSLPTLNADVERPEKVKVRYLNTDEKLVEIEADDLFARVILHEYDHLIGKLIPDRTEPRIRKKLQRKLKDIMNRNVNVNYPITEKK
jgi:peptide deformylase